MRKLSLLTVTILISFATFAKEDSLIARIGKKAKVIFYSESTDDLKEIGKYDLNLLFKELKKRSEKNFSLSEEVTLKEADELKNREVNTTVKPKRWFRNMNLNLFAGISNAVVQRYKSGLPGIAYSAHFMGPFCIYNDKTYSSLFVIGSEPSTMFGIGGYYDKTLKVKRKTAFSLRYGLGFDFVGSKMTIKNVGTLEVKNYTQQGSVIIPGKEASERNLYSSNLYTEIQPMLNFINANQEKTFKLGLGVKLVSSLNNLGTKAATNNYLYIPGSPAISLNNKAIQTAITASFGYKYINLFFHAIPNNIQIIDTSATYFLSINSPRQISATSYVLGLRFGK
jgi:hypothetical protein